MATAGFARGPVFGFLPSKAVGKGDDVDVEAGPSLVPGMDAAESELRWGFIRKVYGIVGAQLAITAVVGSAFALIPSLRLFAIQSAWFQIASMALPFLLLGPLYLYRQSHPTNLAILAVWTASLSMSVGLACSFYQGAVVAEALALTAVVVLSLTAYTFMAAKKGRDFGYMGPMLFAGLWTMLLWGLIHLVIQPGSTGLFIFSLLGALLFSLYIVYDTESLIKRHSYDEFVWASVTLYLDIINLFLHILRILQKIQRASEGHVE